MPPNGAKIIGTTTRLDHKIDNGVLSERKVRMCVRGNLQSEDSFTPTDLRSPVLKASEARLLTAIAAEHGCLLLNTDIRQAFLSGDMEDGKVCFRTPDLWPEPIARRQSSMKSQGDDFIIHCLFVGDKMHMPTRDALKKKFMAKYCRHFNITVGCLMETFLVLQVEQIQGFS